MNSISKEGKQELIKILEALIEIIALMREEKDEFFLQQNEGEVKEWLLYLRMHDDKEELQSLSKEISIRYHQKYDQLCEKTTAGKDSKNIYSEKYSVDICKYNHWLREYPQYNTGVINYGADSIRAMLMEIYLEKSSEFLK